MYQEFEKTIKFRYEVSLPWKQFHPELSDQYDLSLKRLVALLKRVRETPEVLCRYDAIIQDQIKKGIMVRNKSWTPINIASDKSVSNALSQVIQTNSITYMFHRLKGVSVLD